MSTSKLTQLSVDKGLLPHIDQAMMLGLESVNGVEPLVPFAMLWHDTGESSIHERQQGTYDDAIEALMRYVSDYPGELIYYAVLWEGFVSVDGEKKEALILEAGHKGSGEAMQLAQAYVLDEQSCAIADGDLMYLGKTSCLLDGSADEAILGRQHLLKPAFTRTSDIIEQPFAQMIVAAICLAANQVGSKEADRITVGIHLLQQAEQRIESPMAHRIFGVVLSEVAEGDLMRMLPCDDFKGLLEVLVIGVRQLRDAVDNGLVLVDEVQVYLGSIVEIMRGILSNEGKEILPEGGEQLLGIIDKAFGATSMPAKAA